MKNKLLLILFILLLIPIVSANSYNFKQNAGADLKVSCFDDNNILCTAATSCHITIISPDSTTLVSNGSMTRGVVFYNYTLISSQTSVLGQYSAVVYCSGGTDAYTQFNYLITQDGIDMGNNNNLLLLLILGAVIFLVLGFIFEAKIFGIISGAMFIVVGIYIMIYGIYSLSNLYTRSLSYVAIGVGIILWVATAIDYIEDSKDSVM